MFPLLSSLWGLKIVGKLCPSRRPRGGLRIASAHAAHPTGPFPWSDTAWEHTPGAVPGHRWAVHPPRQDLHQPPPPRPIQVAQLPGRRPHASPPARPPPSADAPGHKRPRRSSAGQPGAQTGQAGAGPLRLAPTAVHAGEPAPCAGGRGARARALPASTPQGLAGPPIAMPGPQGAWSQGPGHGGGQRRHAAGPPGAPPGDGPRVRARRGALAGRPGTSGRRRRACGQAVWPRPRSLGTGHPGMARGSAALAPHEERLAARAHQAPGGDLEATPWEGHNRWPWRGTRAPATVTGSLLHPHRSPEACGDLSDAGQGLLGSDGDGGEQTWGPCRHPCGAPGLRTASGVAEPRAPARAACGAWARAAVPRWCPRAPAPPRGGEWHAWSARWCPVLGRAPARHAEAGRLARR